MRQCTKKLLALLTALALTVSMSGAALAAPSADHVSITSPKSKAVYYIGEKIPLKATLKKYETGYYTEISSYFFALSKKGSDKTLWSDALADGKDVAGDEVDETPPLFPDGKPYKYSKSLKTAKYKAGTYTIEAAFMGYLTHTSEENAIEDGRSDLMTTALEEVSVNVTLKKLKAPTKLKASTGKRKVTVSWKKADGAKKYEVWRSTKKNSGYKKIATTTKTKYGNKKLKKGKRYYYQVRTLRGSVKSGFTKPVLSGKVK